MVGPWIFTCWLFGIYASQRMKTVVDELQRLLRGVALGLLVLAGVGFFVKELHFGRFVVLAAAGINLVLQGASRVFFHRIEKRMRRSGEHDVKVLIAGTGVAAIRLLQKLQDHPETGYRVAGFLADTPDEVGKDVANRPVLGHVDELREVALREGVSEIFVAMPSLGHTRLLSLVLECEDLGITFRVVTNLFEVLTAGSPLDLIDDLPLVQLGRDRPNPLYAPIKRALDLLGAALGLLVTGPVLLACVWRIRRERRALGLLRADAHRAARPALHLLQAAHAARGRGPLHRRRRRPARIRASPRSGACCAARASTSCRSSGTCCAARCRWWGRAPRCPSSSTATTIGSAGG